MALFRRGLITGSFLAALLCIVLLMNFTAPNPTGRRYSSEVPQYINDVCQGVDAERILSTDLQMVQNDSTNVETLCICSPNSTGASTRCNTCILTSSEVGNQAHIPDFINDQVLIDSKCAENLQNNSQYRSFLDAAQQTNRELWYFVRIKDQTHVSSQMLADIQATGGDIVPYFTVAGYVDPVDRMATNGLIVALVVLMLLTSWEMRIWRFISFGVLPSTPVSLSQSPDDVLTKAENKTAEAEAFKKQIEKRVQINVDIDDAQND